MRTKSYLCVISLIRRPSLVFVMLFCVVGLITGLRGIKETINVVNCIYISLNIFYIMSFFVVQIFTNLIVLLKVDYSSI